LQPFNVSLRGVRSFICPDDGLRYFTTNKEDVTDRVGDTICNHCGQRLAETCTTWNFIEDTEKNAGVCLRVGACRHFEPMLTFQPPLVGFFGTFTTFRTGAAWVSRLLPGRTVSLYNVETKQVFGRAVVEWVEAGPLEDMLAKYAHMNHSQKVHDGVLGAPDRLRSRLRRLYGPNLIADGKQVSVICLNESINLPNAGG
jgi:hypothetical protein